MNQQIDEQETTRASNEATIRNLYEVAEKEPKRFRSLFTENGYWWDVPAGLKYEGDEVARGVLGRRSALARHYRAGREHPRAGASGRGGA